MNWYNNRNNPLQPGQKVYIYFSKDQYCETCCNGNGCYSCELENDCNCELIPIPRIFNNNQPERSKREDSDCVLNCEDYSCTYYPDACNSHSKICKLEMRCSEHCGNTVRDK